MSSRVVSLPIGASTSDAKHNAPTPESAPGSRADRATDKAPHGAPDSTPDSAADNAPASGERLRGLVLTHSDSVFRLLRRLGVPEADVPDAAQKTFLAMASRLEGVEPARERAFLLGVAVRVASHARRARRRDPIAREHGDEAVGCDTRTPEVLTHHLRARQLLDRILDSMDDTLREPFVLFEIEQLSMAEIAEELGLPQGTVASRLRRARQELKERLARWQREEGGS